MVVVWEGGALKERWLVVLGVFEAMDGVVEGWFKL